MTVRDVNDNAPVFDTPSVLHIPENSARGTLITVLRAHDADLGVNAQFKFTLASTERTFALDDVTGVLTVNTALDRETRDKYVLLVTVTDQGFPALTTDLNLTVFVVDSNDHDPVFAEQLYRLEVSEDRPIGSSLLAMLARDDDVGTNAELRYRIREGNEFNYFRLNSISGVLSVWRPLDYELFASHNLVVEAVDLGLPSRTATTRVSVLITDVNDCTPAFVNLPLSVSVQENLAQVPLDLMTIRARDDDTGAGGRISYRIIGGDNNIFSIGFSDGRVTLMSSLDREDTSVYELVVQAANNGKLKHQSIDCNVDSVRFVVCPRGDSAKTTNVLTISSLYNCILGDGMWGMALSALFSGVYGRCDILKLIIPIKRMDTILDLSVCPSGTHF